MTNILVKNLETFHSRALQTEKFSLSNVEFSNTVKKGEGKNEKFDSFPEGINEKDNKTPKLDSDDENSFTETNKTDNNFIKDDLINFNIQIKKKGKQKQEIEFIDHESEPNAIFRVRVKMGGAKTKDFVVKALRIGKKIYYHNEINQSHNEEEADIICRVGNNDEIILKENIQTINGKYLF